MDKKFYKTLFVIALPITLQNLMQSAINMLDTIMVGQLGSLEIASVGLGNQIFFILNMIIFGINSGGGIFIAQYWGKKDINGIHRMQGFMLTISIVISSVFLLVSFFFPEFLLSLYSNDIEVIKCGSKYLRCVAFCYPLFAISFSYALVLRSTEKVKLPMYATIISLIINVLLNYVLIFGKFGFPKIGVIGAAIATVVSRFIELVILLCYSFHRKYDVATSLKNLLSFRLYDIRAFIKIALPVVLNESLWGLGISMQSLIMARSGTDAISAFSITNNVNQLSGVLLIGVGNAASVIIGKKIGEKNENEARRYANKIAIFMFVMAIFIGAFMYPLAQLLPKVFNVDEQVLYQAKKMIYILMCFYPLNSFNMCIIVGICRSGGDTIFAGIADVGFLWLVSIPISAIAAFLLHQTSDVIYFCLSTEQIIKSIAGFIRLKSGKWLHNVIE